MFILFCLCMTILTVYVDAVSCLVAKHNFNWKTSVVSAIFWPILWIIVIVAVVKETKEY